MTQPEKRKPLTPLQRVKLFDAHDGICAICGYKIQVGERWRDEHMRALGLLGTNALDNRAPVHVRCAKAKDADDIPRIAKAKRQRASHIGAKTSPRPMAGGRNSPWRRHMDGRVELRHHEKDAEDW